MRQLDSEILDLTEDEHVESEIQNADEYKDGVYAAVARIDHYTQTHKAPSRPSPPPLADATHTTARAVAEHRVKLPKLSIRPFEGDITQWTGFWDSFNSAIHTNASLTNIDKFNYLRSLLKSTAREAISGLTLTEANYGEAISVLKRRFGNKQQIISRHMDTLVSISKRP